MTNGRDEGAALWQDETLTMSAAHLDALTADQSVTDGDQAASDTGQAASDTGQAARTTGRVRLEQLRERAALDRARADSERRHVAAATRARLREELHGSHLDDLTRAFRRETEWHALNLEIDRSRRGDGRFVLAFLDIDDLKGINDRAGHAAGDLVLRTLVATLRSSLRSFDPIVRFGGDEFVCGIGGADIREVEGRLAGTQRSLYADTGASFSVGLAVLAAGETLEQLTTRADAALLDAKASRPD
ncbi:MAG TPA: GGDEF domain-containing protein [Candidatus Limnocylindrales bacterium]